MYHNYEQKRRATQGSPVNDSKSVLSVTNFSLCAQEKMARLKTNESKLEEDKKNLRAALDEAETRCTKLELSRRSLDGELQRLRLAMTDKETENQVSERLNYPLPPPPKPSTNSRTSITLKEYFIEWIQVRGTCEFVAGGCVPCMKMKLMRDMNR